MQVATLARQIRNEAEQKFVLSGLLVSSDKFISKEDAENIRREISMTKVGQLLFEEGMEQGIERGMEQGIECGIERGMERGIERGIEVFILDNLEEQVPMERILKKLQQRFLLDRDEADSYFKKFAFQPDSASPTTERR